MFSLNADWPIGSTKWLAKSNRQMLLVDSHTGGNPTRIVVGGLEPGLYPPMCCHCMIGFASVIVELDLNPDLWSANSDEGRFRIRTPAGPIAVTVRKERQRFTPVTLTNVPSYIVRQDRHPVNGQDAVVELLYGGDFYVSVDAESIGLSLSAENATDIVSLARLLRSTYTEGGVRDPLTGELLDVYQVMFYRLDPANPQNAKVVVVAPPGVIDRSPCGTGSSALFAKLITEGALRPDETLTAESIIGSTFSVAAERVEERPKRRLVTSLLTGRAYINGFLNIVVDDEDRLADGFAPL